MMAYICLIWIGATLSAPWWYYVLLAAGAMAKIFKDFQSNN